MFRIKSLTLQNHHVLGNIYLDFQKECDLENLNFTAIIGKNGVGKSHVLKCICEILNNSWLQYTRRKRKGLSYNYILDIEVDGRLISVKKDLYPFGFFELLYGKRLISVSTYITDKFPSVSNEFYKYCGVRNESMPQLTSTRGLIRKTVDWMLDSLEEKVGFTEELKDLLGEMNLEPHLRLEYEIRYRDIFVQPDMTADKLRDIFNNQSQYFLKRSSSMWGTKTFMKFEDDVKAVENIARYLRNIAALKGIQKSLSFDLLGEDVLSLDDIMALKMLSAIGILSYPHLRIFKRDNHFEFIDSSSGETSVLCSILAIMSNIRQNSIVLIDEPEQSCHPNWQINYLPILKRIFRNYKSCQFIIATHSHFILSDLDPVDSSLVVLDYNEDKVIEDRANGSNPYCWSSDDILYRVFKVRNTRNYVFEERMMRLYSLMEYKEQNQEAIKELVVELENYQLNENDPLKKLINQAKECLN